MNDLNQDAKPAEEKPDESSDIGEEFAGTSDDLISTVEFTDADADPEGANNAEGLEDPDKEAAEAKAAAELETGEEDPNKDLPFHTHPRFKEIVTKRNEAEEKLATAEKELETFRKAEGPGKETGPGKEDPQFDDIMEMSNDDIVDAMQDDPKKFLSNFATQVAHEVGTMFREELGEKETAEKEEATKESINKTYREYGEKNKSFGKLWKSGEIQQFMKDNPGHNAISAHQMLTSKAKNDDVQKAIDAAVKEAREDTLKDVKNKQNAHLLGGGPSQGGKSHNTDPQLKDPKSFGGATTVLVRRSLARLKKARG